MPRLVAFGCSYTYGHGLDDCVTGKGHPGPFPSKYAWPQLLASKLDLECVNMGIPGASNKEIWKTIMDFDFRANDKVFILWSLPNRWCIYKDSKTIERIGPWVNSKLSKMFYKILYSEYDQITDLNLRMSHASHHLNSMNLENYHHHLRDLEIQRYARHANRFTNVEPFAILSEKYKLAKDRLHPGVEAHVTYVNNIIKEIT